MCISLQFFVFLCFVCIFRLFAFFFLFLIDLLTPRARFAHLGLEIYRALGSCRSVVTCRQHRTIVRAPATPCSTICRSGSRSLIGCTVVACKPDAGAISARLTTRLVVTLARICVCVCPSGCVSRARTVDVSVLCVHVSVVRECCACVNTVCEYCA